MTTLPPTPRGFLTRPIVWLSAALAVGVVAGLNGLRAQESRPRSEGGRSEDRRDSAAASTNGATKQESGGFQSVARLIADRNIFDPERQPRTPGSTPRPVAKPQAKADAPEFGLVGIMDYSRGRFAFFDGNASEYRKALQQNASIGGHVVTGITGSSVTLAQGTNAKPVELHVGARLRKNSDGAWELAAGGGSAFSPKSSSSETSGDTPSSGAASGNAAEDEVLKRLLKKREQEMK